MSAPPINKRLVMHEVIVPKQLMDPNSILVIQGEFVGWDVVTCCAFPAESITHVLVLLTAGENR